MKRYVCSFVAACFLLALGLTKAPAQQTKYWDINNSLPGATDDFGFADGTWDTSTPNWNLNPAGTDPTTTWNPGDDAVFSAGDDVLDDPEISGAFVTISGTQVAGSVLIENGWTAFRGGDIDTPTITVEAGATMDIDSVLRHSTNVEKVTLRGGRVHNTNPGVGGSFLRATSELEIDGTGIITYDGQGTGIVSILLSVITGVGGTVDNGGAGTLIMRGPDRISPANFQIGDRWSQELYTFSKLVVEGGMYQPRHQNAPTAAAGVGIFETVFGAVPLEVLPDAVTLNGGQIAVNDAVTTHPNRGFTVGPNGGGYNGIGFGTLTITGPFSGSGTFTMQAGGGGMRLQNPNNTFSGDLVINATTLFVDAPLSPASLAGTGGTVNIAAGSTLTVGAGNTDTTYDGNATGAGGLTKVGTGTQTLTNNNYTGDTRVEGGILSLANATLGDDSDVYLFTGGVLDLNFAETDTIRSLFIDDAIQSVGTWGAPGSGADFTTNLLSGTGLLNVTLDMPPVGLPGDFNENGIVDAADYTVWRDNIGQPGLPNDEGLGTVGPAHFDLWKSNFGNTAPGAGSALGVSAVPEPGTLVLLLASLAGLALVRRGR